MNILKRLLLCLCITYGIDGGAEETNGCVTSLTPFTTPTVSQIIAMSTTELRVFPLLISTSKEESPRTGRRNVTKSELAILEPSLLTHRQPTNSPPSEEVLALSRLLSRQKETGDEFRLSKRLSLRLARTEPEIGGVRASFNWKFKR